MHYKFHKVYIELTNICGLECTFCPTKDIKPQTMTLDTFETIIKQIKPYTNNIALHVFGDPLTLSNLEHYLDIALEYNIKVDITTTGYYLNNFKLELFLHKAIKQINFSLNSYNKNEMDLKLDQYLKPMLLLCDLKLKNKIKSFINFRLWNLDETNSEKSFNKEIFKILSSHFKLDLSNIDPKGSKRVENQILINFDNYFKWPSLNDSKISHGYCHGLSSQLAILSSGKVVPCCLDSFGIIDLGNIEDKSLKDILFSQKALNIKDGFKKNIAVEELCQKCTYKNRFNLL
ncbi:MAG: SPASM domain-containing protein [Campylobacterota bacterium]|nr:SPASM domain-containing protein [Campylobacterota bacterium]